eukprot:6492166-Amphidinium_carterae.3
MVRTSVRCCLKSGGTQGLNFAESASTRSVCARWSALRSAIALPCTRLASLRPSETRGCRCVPV